ncbi:MAG: GWxTD domain-containing protein [Rhodothermales bacterium]|nr:GWxTD domain-containing protein [Rhodothermales bacterium]
MLALLGPLTLGAQAQVAYQPEFDVDVVSVKPERGTDARVDIYTKIPYQSLRFLSQEGGFAAGYTVSVNVYRTDEEGRAQGLVRTRTWERGVEAPTYEATQLDTLADFATQSLALAPGRYALEVEVEDAASGRTFVREVPIRARSFAGAVAMSDLLLADRYDAAERVLTPNVANAVGSDQEDFTVFYEVYAAEPQRLRVRYTATELGRERRRPSALNTLLGIGERDAPEPESVYEATETLRVGAGRNPAALALTTEAFDAGDYVFHVELRDDSGAVVAEAEKAFQVRWMGLDAQIQDLESAIAQLRYVAKDREIRAIRRAETAEEQVRLFRAFWDKRDPTPGTRRNERMEEYYYRVAYANKNYGRFANNGWNTDRGEVYIRFGEPDIVERHPFNYGTKPYEIWYYNGHGRRFIFVDETGMGDYELLIPVWDDRTRM